MLISPPDLKNTTDDALTPYLTTLPQPYTFTKDNTNSNVRFIIGYTAVAIAGATFYVDRILGWEATEAPWVSVAVVSYFILNSILTYWIWAVEAGEVFRGKRKSGETVCLRHLYSASGNMGRCCISFHIFALAKQLIMFTLTDRHSVLLEETLAAL